MIYFIIAFIVCFVGYLYHTLSHFFEHKGKKFPHSILEIMIFLGYLAWGFMIYFDPVKMDSPYYVTWLGLLIGFTGIMIGALATVTKKGFHEIDHLVTIGIYSKVKNPMYLGLILVHIGFPIATQSLLTLASAIIWIPQILIWKRWEEEDLEKRFGKEYAEYKKSTLF